MVTIKGEEKIREDAVEQYKKDMALTMVKKEYLCSGCKGSPRPGDTMVKKCGKCSNIFCGGCVSHSCRNGAKVNAKVSVPLTLTINLDIKKYMPYLCKNNKFGCEEILVNETKLIDHEKYCNYQVSHPNDLS